jgi:hypothetical protein
MMKSQYLDVKGHQEGRNIKIKGVATGKFMFPFLPRRLFFKWENRAFERNISIKVDLQLSFSVFPGWKYWEMDTPPSA